MSATRWALLATLVACWAPYGLIHQGQRMISAKAAPIIALLQARCDPADPDWKGCR